MTMENICVKCYMDIDPSEEQICSSCRKNEIEKYEELIKKIEKVFKVYLTYREEDALQYIKNSIKEFRNG